MARKSYPHPEAKYTAFTSRNSFRKHRARRALGTRRAQWVSLSRRRAHYGMMMKLQYAQGLGPFGPFTRRRTSSTFWTGKLVVGVKVEAVGLALIR